jgi:hypothetical protein
MRPKLVFYLLVVVECFLLVMMIVPGVSFSKSLRAAQQQYVQSPSPETEQALENQQAQRKLKQTWLCGGAVGVLTVMIIYGWKNKARI